MKGKSMAAVAVSAVLAGTAIVGSVNVFAGQKAPAAKTATVHTVAKTASVPTLTMATSADYKPYEYHQISGGQDKIVGFDIDVAKAIAKQLHFKFTIQDMDFDSLIGALQSHRADFVIAGMTPTAARAKSVDFSHLYYQATNVIVTKKGVKVTSLSQLKGKTVAAQLGSTQETLADGIKGATVDKQTLIPQVVQEVLTGHAYAAVVEDTVAVGYTKSDPLQMNTIKGLKSNGSAIAFPKGSKWVSKFNKAIATLKKDGEMKKLEAKWFGPSK